MEGQSTNGKHQIDNQEGQCQRVAVYACPYEPCKKTFPRNRDLNRHTKNHIRNFECSKCDSRFPSPKDLSRHNSSLHDRDTKYHCPLVNCEESIARMAVRARVQTGFMRKDNWRRHMRHSHHMNRQELRDVEEKGIPTVVRLDGKWVVRANSHLSVT